MIRVLIIDDSISIQSMLKNIINNTNNMTVIGIASNPYEAIEILKSNKPDVITLDIEMPGMSGLDFLKKLMHYQPIPVIMFSSLTQKGAHATIEALSLGAVDFISKRVLKTKKERQAFVYDLRSKIQSASKVQLEKKLRKKKSKPESSITKLSQYKKVIAIGASTGGVQALNTLIPKFPGKTPPILIVQHMPKFFTKAFADSLDKVSKIRVKEGVQGEAILDNHAYIAPGGYHMGLKKRGNNYIIETNESAKINRHRPSVDYTFKSLGNYFSTNAIAIILTGMGDDGARGIKYLKDKGTTTIAESQKTAVIFGMPQKAIQLNAIDYVVDLNRIDQLLF